MFRTSNPVTRSIELSKIESHLDIRSCEVCPLAGAKFRTINNRGHLASVIVFIQIGWVNWTHFEYKDGGNRLRPCIVDLSSGLCTSYLEIRVQFDSNFTTVGFGHVDFVGCALSVRLCPLNRCTWLSYLCCGRSFSERIAS